MGIVGIILVIASVAIIGYIILDTYLGAPPKPRTVLVVLGTAIIGVMLIFIDYSTQPTTTHAELTTGEIEFLYKSQSNKLTRPTRIRLKRNVYPWYSIFHRNKLDITIVPEIVTDKNK